MVSPLARRSVVNYLTKTGKCSERRACVVVGLSRSLVRYIARRSKDEAMLIKEIHKLAIRHSRYGYRRIAVLLRRECCKINRKRVHRMKWLFLTRGVPKFLRSDNEPSLSEDTTKICRQKRLDNHGKWQGLSHCRWY